MRLNIAKNSKKGGFTLVELMVVAIIVAILAAVAIPLMSANKKRAASTEAEAALGSIRTAMRALYAETGAYDTDLNGGTIAALSDVPGISVADLDGKYFIGTDYSLDDLGPGTYTATATGRDGTIVEDVILSLDQAGTQLRTGL